MRTRTEDEFLAWATRAGFQIDPRYPHSTVLTFNPDPGLDRFWLVPDPPERRPFFVASLLDLMADWQACFVWKHMGSWPSSVEATRINDVVAFRVIAGLGLPLGTSAVVKFERADYDKLVTLLFTTTIFGWSVSDDLYVVPDHGRQLLQTDHHGVIHASFRDESTLQAWVAEMDRREFPLPDEPPDETFKYPSWMEPPEE